MARIGRAPKTDNLTIRHTVRVSDDDDKKISEYCEKTGQSKSDLYRIAVMRVLDGENKEK